MYYLCKLREMQKRYTVIIDWLKIGPRGVWNDQWLFQISVKPIFSAAPVVSLCLLSAAHLFWQWSHILIHALCLNKVARVQINGNWCCQCRKMAKNSRCTGEYSARQAAPPPPQIFTMGAALCHSSCALPDRLTFEYPTSYKVMKRLKLQFNPQKLRPQFQNNVRVLHGIRLKCVDADIFSNHLQNRYFCFHEVNCVLIVFSALCVACIFAWLTAMSKAAVKISADLLSNPLCEQDQAFLDSMTALDTAMRRMDAFNQEKVRLFPTLGIFIILLFFCFGFLDTVIFFKSFEKIPFLTSKVGH